MQGKAGLVPGLKIAISITLLSLSAALLGPTVALAEGQPADNRRGSLDCPAELQEHDGGGSSRLWCDGLPQVIHPSRDPRTLTNYPALYGPAGTGIELPLDAAPLKTVFFKVLKPGEAAEVVLEVQNSGGLSWMPQDDVALRATPLFALGQNEEMLPLDGAVHPGEIGRWTWQAGVGSTVVRRLRMVQEEQPFGPEFALVVFTLPKGLEDKPEEIEKAIQDMVDRWKAKGAENLDKLLEEIWDYLKRLGMSWLERLWQGIKDALGGLTSDACGSAGLAVIAVPAAVVARRRRRQTKAASRQRGRSGVQ